MTDDTTHVPKACAYVTRRGGRQLLVFRGPSHDAFQIPKGTVESGETPRAAVRRELREESGLTASRGVCCVARDRWQRRPGRVYRRYFFHVAVPDAPDEWTHEVTGDGPEAGRTFRYQWLDRPVETPLALDLHHQLDALPAPAGRQR